MCKTHIYVLFLIMKTKVSIVIPFYNNPEFLEEMIESILTQSYRNWELLLVDDGADKKTLDCAEYYAGKDNRIKILKRHRLPKGAQTCRNLGLENAIGEYICFFDSDDIVLQDCLTNRVRYMDDNPNLDFGVFRAKTYDPLHNTEVQYLGVRSTSDDIKYFINGFLPFTVWTNIYRTESLIHTSASWDENILSFQDSDFNIQNIVVRKLKYNYYEGNVDYLWRVNCNNNSITKKIYSDSHFESHLYFLEKTIKTIKSNFGSVYDYDLSTRLFSFGLIFSEQYKKSHIKRLTKLGRLYNLKVNFKNTYKLYHYGIKHIKSKFIKKMVQICIFPQSSYKRHQIINTFLAETYL